MNVSEKDQELLHTLSKIYYRVLHSNDLERLDSRASSAECSTNRSWGGGIVPVGAPDDGVVGSKVVAAEAQVVGAQGTIRRDDIAKVACDTAVISDLVARAATEIAAEGSKAGVELFKDDGLSLDFADLLRDDPECSVDGLIRH